MADLERIEADLATGDLSIMLTELLTAEELAALATRIRRLVRRGAYPSVPLDRPEIPWPPV
jgi:hypothetical protein